MQTKTSKCSTPFEGEAIIPFKVYPRGMDNLLFAFCVMGENDSRWAGEISVSGSDDPYYWEQVSAGKTMVIVDKNTGCTHHLDSEKMMQGIRRWIEHGFGTFQEGKVVLGLNESVADKIVQFALFEEVRYE